VTEVITNLLERETFVQQVRSAGVTQNVRAMVRQMATQSSNSKRDGAGSMARLHWPVRSEHKEKNEKRGELWEHHLKKLEDAFFHLYGTHLDRSRSWEERHGETPGWVWDYDWPGGQGQSIQG
jgi:hypothetical protein